MKIVTSVFILTCCLLPFSVSAQVDNSAAMERMDRLERDLMLVQRQLARGGSTSYPTSNSNSDLPAGGSAQLEVRLSTIEDEMRSLRGKVEENEFQMRKLNETLDKFQKDTEFRFNELSGAPPGTPPQAAKPDEKLPAGKTADAPPDGPTTAGDGVLHPPETGKKTEFATPREHYNYAFRMLNQMQYDEAATNFESFTKKYPKDPLVGNAYYWGGETYYIRRDYVHAADNFRQGFEAVPDGPKAADNLLKLAMSLNALNRDKEACVVLQQITARFKQSSTSVTQKATQERKRIGCN